MSESLYFIAIVPPAEIQEEIMRFKQQMADKFGSKHALNSPPHVTLRMPFKWKDKKLDKLVNLMNQLNAELQPFSIQLKDFDFFEPRVVFVDVVPNKKLAKLQKNVVDLCRKVLKLENGNYKDQGFHPHITIGFRDLKKRMFYEAKQEFEAMSYGARFSASKIDLLKHDGKKWNAVAF